MPRDARQAPAQGHRLDGESGTSLAELVIVLAIASRLVAFAVPTTGATIDAGRASQAASVMASRFRLARLEAVSQSRSIGLVFDQQGGRWTFRVCADGNGNGITDAADYVTWRAHSGQSASLVRVGANSSSVPEPSFAAIAMLGLCLTTAGFRSHSAAKPRVNDLAGNILRRAEVRFLAESPLLTQRR